jgi:hypothetical protein
MEKMVSEVNSRLPADQRFSATWWSYAKYQRLFQEYRRFYPTGARIRQLRNLTAFMVLDSVVLAMATGLGVGAAVFLAIAGSILLWTECRLAA